MGIYGLSNTWGHLFGLPHIGAEYTDYGSGAYRLLDGERCVACQRQATNVHHVVPKSVAKVAFIGDAMLRSPLFALCGSGTTGCHGGFHGGARYKARWEWDSPEYEERWWDGLLLDRLGPHSDELFGYGEYVVDDRVLDEEIHIRAR
jgi:hypothetical protein